MLKEPNPEDVSIEEITPEIAVEYLKHNTGNRRFKARKVAAFARDMQTGDWRWNGETIKFGQDGQLIDGQNRLQAIIDSGTTQWFLVVYNVERSAQATIDTGTARTMADTLKMRGYPDPPLLGGALRILWVWEQGGRNFRASNMSPTISELLMTLDKHTDMVNVVRGARNLTASVALTPAVSGFVLYKLHTIDKNDAEDFFYKLRTGAELTEDNPIYQLRRALERLRVVTKNNASYMVDQQVALVFKGWNRFRAGQSSGSLSIRLGGMHPEAFPEPY